MRRFLPLFLIVLLTGAQCSAQAITDAAIGAFTASYASETAKDYNKAINDLKGIYNERFYEANIRMGWLHYLKKDYELAQRYYRLAIKTRPGSIEALTGLVAPAAAAQNWTEVFATYQRILALDPNHSLTNYRIALMYYYRKEFAQAEKHLQRIVERYPFDYDIVLLTAQVKLALGKLGESKTYYQRALLYNPSNTDIRTVLSKL